MVKAKELVAGRELDAMVAEMVMGLDVVWSRRSVLGWRGSDIYDQDEPCFNGDPSGTFAVPCYSKDILAVLEVVERLRSSQSNFDLTWHGGGWHCNFNTYMYYADTAPLAICLAALEAVDAKGV